MKIVLQMVMWQHDFADLFIYYFILIVRKNSIIITYYVSELKDLREYLLKINLNC